MTQQTQKGREAVAALLRLVDDETREAGELFEQWARHRKHRYEGEHKLAEEREREYRAYRNRLAYLKRKKLVKTKKIEGRLLLELSDEGRAELLKREMRERPKLPEGYACLVVYDVPVDAKAGRDAFRFFLKGSGFTQIQKSVWQSDRDVFQGVETFVRRAKIQEWVVLYLAKKQ